MLSNSGLNLLSRSRDAYTLIRQAHLMCKSAMWDPFGAIPSIGFLHHFIDLFQA